MPNFSDDGAVRVILEQNLALRAREAIGAGERPEELRARLAKVLDVMCAGLHGCVDKLAVTSSRTAVAALLDERVRATYGIGRQLDEWVAAAHKWDALLGETFYTQLDECLRTVEKRDVDVSSWAIIRVFQMALALGFVGKFPPGSEFRQQYVARLEREAERCRGRFLQGRKSSERPDQPAPEASQPAAPPPDVLRAEFLIGVVAAIGLIVAMWFLC